MSPPSDIVHMRHALRLAARGLGRVAPNPAVGCIIVSPRGDVVGRGWTGAGGRPHAETEALKRAGKGARGATAYVTLEPCTHHGATPPCADALIAGGIVRAVVAVRDPDARVNGKGIAKLRDAGIATDEGVCESDASFLNAGFFKRVASGRPLVALKIAQSADGRVASASGESKWITGEEARRFGHLLRAEADAILVGAGTALADDPDLTCRLPGMEDRSPLRVVLDSQLRLSPDSRLARSARDVPVVLFTARKDGGEALAAQGVEIARVEADAHGRPDLRAVLDALGMRGMTRLLVEGGPTIHAAFLNAHLADRVHLFRASRLLGGGGRAAVDALAVLGLAQAPRLEPLERQALGADLLETFAIKA